VVGYFPSQGRPIMGYISGNATCDGTAMTPFSGNYRRCGHVEADAVEFTSHDRRFRPGS
jgi:hypothetical protein